MQIIRHKSALRANYERRSVKLCVEIMMSSDTINHVAGSSLHARFMSPLFTCRQTCVSANIKLQMRNFSRIDNVYLSPVRSTHEHGSPSIEKKKKKLHLAEIVTRYRRNRFGFLCARIRRFSSFICHRFLVATRISGLVSPR